MPRQLSWLKGSSTKKQAKSTSKSSAKHQPSIDGIDDNFFDGTILAPSRKVKDAVAFFEQSDEDGLPELPPSTSYQRGESTAKRSASREQSSSPPPGVGQPLPSIDYMRKAVSQYDLRDDEWRMVEDEFLSTAQSFTRDLLLKDYEKFKEIMKTKKPVARPVVPDAKPPDQSRVTARADKQSKTQKKALKEIFTASGKKDLDKILGPTRPARENTGSRSVPGPSRSSDQIQRRMDTSDSEDLDAQNPPPLRSHAASRMTKTSFMEPTLPNEDTHKQSMRGKSPVKASAPKPTTATSRPNHRTSFIDPFDDEFTTSFSPQTKPNHTSAGFPPPYKPTQPSRIRPSATPSKSADIFSELDIPQRNPVVKEHADRLAKRKAEREKEQEREKKKKAIKLEDIPTFMF